MGSYVHVLAYIFTRKIWAKDAIWDMSQCVFGMFHFPSSISKHLKDELRMYVIIYKKNELKDWRERNLYYWYGFRAATTIDIKSKKRCGFKELRHPESIIHWNDNNGPPERPSIDRNGQDNTRSHHWQAWNLHL